jgi:hypothetical protein
MDIKVIVYSTCLTDYTQSLRNPNLRILNEMVGFHGDIELEGHPLDDSSRTQFIEFKSAHVQTQDCMLRVNLDERAALGVI